MKKLTAKQLLREVREIQKQVIANGGTSKVSSDDLEKSMLSLIEDIKKALNRRDDGALKKIKPSSHGIESQNLAMELTNLLYGLAYMIKK